jgi:universal stress protein A
MARRRHAPVILLHTIEPLAVDPLAAPLSGEWEAAMVTAAEEALKSQADDLRKSGLVVDVQVQVGTAAGSILEAAAAAKAELIVLGTHGRRGPARLFLGSCAEEVVRSAACPVLVTGANGSGLERWDGTAPLNLTVVVDGSRACSTAFS